MSFPSLPKDVNQIPISSIYIPGTGFVALQGVTATTDGSGNASAGVVAALYGKVTNPGDTPVLLDSSGRVLIGNLVQIGGQAPQLDNTNKLGVSLYGKNAAAGDTAILLDSSGRQVVNVNTMPAITGAVTTSQTDLTGSGTMSAAQPVISTPVSNATVVLALGTGQSTWKAQLKDGGGGFTSGTTLVADKSIDGGTTYFATSFKVAGASPSTPQSTVVGPGPLELTGMAAGATHIRIRCSVLNSTETIAVRINASSGVAEVGLMGSIPAGANTIGSVNVANANANGQTTMSASAPVAIASDQSKLPTKAASGDFVDGSIATIGAQADTTATTDSGTFSLIALFKRLLAKFPTIGAQATSASLAVNIASDQVVPMKLSTVAVYSLASTTSTGSTQNSGDLAVGAYREISIDINTTAQAGTSPTVQLFYERKAADGIYYVLWQSAVLTAAANTISTSIGAGMAYNQSLGVTGRLRWVVGGSATPTYTFSANISGK